jgi:hypothetical protein
MRFDLREASEKRRYRREPVGRSVYVRRDGQVLARQVQDISASGARFLLSPKAEHDLVIGATVTVVIEPAALEIEGHVTRVTDEEVAVAFDGLTPEIEAALARGIAAAASNDNPAG